jgi:hypothetical protein
VVAVARGLLAGDQLEAEELRLQLQAHLSLLLAGVGEVGVGILAQAQGVQVAVALVDITPLGSAGQLIQAVVVVAQVERALRQLQAQVVLVS